MKDRVVAFFADLDATLAPHAVGRTLDLYHIGRSSLWWEISGGVATSDVDVVWPDGPSDLTELALTEFGDGTAKARLHDLYLQLVPGALPPLSGGARRRARVADGPWTVLRICYLEPNDLAVTKLTRFWVKDRADIRLLADLGLLDADELEKRLDLAYPYHVDAEGDPIWPRDKAFANLRTVQKYLRGEVREF